MKAYKEYNQVFEVETKPKHLRLVVDNTEEVDAHDQYLENRKNKAMTRRATMERDKLKRRMGFDD